MSKNFTKKDLVLKVSKMTNETQATVFSVIKSTLEALNQAIAEGRTVEIRKFGVFEVRKSKARIGRNPAKPTVSVKIPERAMIRFKAGKEMKEKLEKVDLKKLGRAASPAKKGKKK